MEGTFCGVALKSLTTCSSASTSLRLLKDARSLHTERAGMQS
jgi:hypothetical protein